MPKKAIEEVRSERVVVLLTRRERQVLEDFLLTLKRENAKARGQFAASTWIRSAALEQLNRLAPSAQNNVQFAREDKK